MLLCQKFQSGSKVPSWQGQYRKIAEQEKAKGNPLYNLDETKPGQVRVDGKGEVKQDKVESEIAHAQQNYVPQEVAPLKEKSIANKVANFAAAPISYLDNNPATHYGNPNSLDYAFGILPTAIPAYARDIATSGKRTIAGTSNFGDYAMMGMAALPYVGKYGKRFIKNTTPLAKKAYKLNPRAFKPDPNKFYRGIGQKPAINNVDYSVGVGQTFTMQPRRISLGESAKITNPSPEITAAMARGKNTQIDWLNSDEWLRRRMAATGETVEQANIARRTSLSKLNNSESTVRVGGTAKNIHGQVTFNSDNKALVSINGNSPLNKLEGTANHEYIHASNIRPGTVNGYDISYLQKGIKPNKVDRPANTLNNKGVQKTLDYLDRPYEQQVRGVRALEYLKQNGKWSGEGDVSDEAIDFITGQHHHGAAWTDLNGLVTEMSKDKLKKYLDHVYTTAGAVSTGLLYNKDK